MSKSGEILKRDKKVISPSLTREQPMVYDHASGCYIWDVDGKKYLDFTSSVAVNSAGHNNPEAKKAIIRQLDKGIHCAFSDFYAEKPVQLAEKLLELMPGFEKVFLSNSGTESVEAAYKLARWHSKKKWVIAFLGAFHGRTMGSLSMTNSKPVQRARFEPFLPVTHLPYPNSYKMKMESEECSQRCLSILEDQLKAGKNDIAAVFMEPIQGEGGYIVPPASFVRGARELCDEFRVLLCDDEVQAGCFRTGKFLAIENFKVKPDIVSLAKAIGGGVPLGATVSTNRIMDWPPGAHANTFGGNLLACAAGLATLGYMQKKKLGENAVKVGSFMMKELNQMKNETLVDVRGMGLMIGIEISNRKKRNEILNSTFGKGLLLLPAGESAIRICPPLIISKEQAAYGLQILEGCL